MHETVTNSSTANSFFQNSSEDLLSPIALSSGRSKTSDFLGWPQSHGNTDIESWHIPSPHDNTRRGPYSSKMTSSHKEPMSATNQGNRWRFNATGQLVDESASSDWDLADEIVRLRIGESGADDVRGSIRTPPQSKLVSTALSETSPLETSSEASADSSSPHASDHPINVSHSRGSSSDSTVSSESATSASQVLLAPAKAPLKFSGNGEMKGRPHSFSGGLSTADLRRLQTAGDGPGSGYPSDNSDGQGQPAQQWTPAHYRGESSGGQQQQYGGDHPVYPSLAQQNGMPRPQTHQHQQQQQYDYLSGVGGQDMQPSEEDLQVEYNSQQRNFNPISPSASRGIGSINIPQPQFTPSQANASMAYRQQPIRGYVQPGLIPSPTAMGYPGVQHTSHMSLGNTQQLYDMMLGGPPLETHPALTRVQQQHNVFPRTHQHSSSDPSALRDAATLAFLSNSMQAFGAPGMHPSGVPLPQVMGMYPNQFYAPQEPYRDLAAAQMMASRLQPQYSGPYGAASDSMSANGSNGPSANNRKLGLYKTELCRSWEEKGSCRYGNKCQFAHGEDELRNVARHPKYKTEICRTFWVSGSCPYGKRCCFIHTELPIPGVTPGAEALPPPSRPDGRARSMSTNSDPNDASISLLARISAKRSYENDASTPTDMNPSPMGYQFNSRPPNGSLRVDTSTLDNNASMMKQNKSAYPSFAGNGMVHPAEQNNIQSPVPVTAGPDLGRHNNSRVDIVGFNQPRMNKSSANPNLNRHSFNGTEIELNFGTPSPSGHPSFGKSSNADGSTSAVAAPRANGHVRSGSAGNWGSFSRSSNLATASAYPASPSTENKSNSPWSTTELAVGSSRLNETWA